MAASTVDRNVALLMFEDGAMSLGDFGARYRGRFREVMPVSAGMSTKEALQSMQRRGIVIVERRLTEDGDTAAWVSPGPAAATIARSSTPFPYQGRTVQHSRQQPLQPLPQVPQSAQVPQEITVSAAFLNVFKGDDLKNQKHFQRKYGVEVEASQRGALQGRIKVSGDEYAVRVAVSEIQEAAAGDPQSYLEKMYVELGGRSFGNIDWSNVYFGARNGDPDPSHLRINVRALYDRIFAQHELRSLVVAGSAHNAAQVATLTAMWSSVGGDCTPSIRFQVRPSGAREQGVDDSLIASALDQVARDYGDVQQTLVLVTGDGNDNGGGNWVRSLM
jgi:hypothetical protein